jgi:hemerythrin-like domain-containing protein
MTHPQPTDILEAEHRFISKVVGAAGALADKLESGQPVEAETLQAMVDFMRTFADKAHHGKEEDLLFPLLFSKGVPAHGCPIEALAKEHVMGRALVTGLAEAAAAYAKGDPSSRQALLSSLRGIAQLYPNHIWKEDYLLFPMTDRVLDVADQAALYAEFEKVDQAIGQEVHRRYAQLAEELARQTK